MYAKKSKRNKRRREKKSKGEERESRSKRKKLLSWAFPFDGKIEAPACAGSIKTVEQFCRGAWPACFACNQQRLR